MSTSDLPVNKHVLHPGAYTTSQGTPPSAPLLVHTHTSVPTLSALSHTHTPVPIPQCTHMYPPINLQTLFFESTNVYDSESPMNIRKSSVMFFRLGDHDRRLGFMLRVGRLPSLQASAWRERTSDLANGWTSLTLSGHGVLGSGQGFVIQSNSCY